MPASDDPIPPYNHGVAEFAAKFETLSAHSLWAHVRDLIPAKPGAIALDIGAGSGRDAAWLASLGMTAVAAEPADQMLRLGRLLHPELRWLEDRLPDLTAVNRLGLSFDIVLLSAVWMHLRPTDRPRAFRKMATLLKPGGVLLMTLRHGPVDSGRTMHPVTLGEVEALARDHGLTIVRVVDNLDRLGRPEVSWTTVCLRVPDDGTMGLPLIRGVILNDSKSSTYKLGLLRSVAKIADSAPSLAVPSMTDTDQVSVPLGLVALNWIRAYLPLVSAGLPQAPGNAGPDGLGFARAGFRALLALGVMPQDLRIGAMFTGERARAVMSALREARSTIVEMPVRYTTLPNSNARVFEPRSLTVRAPAAFTLDADLLAAFGDLSVPGPIWRTMLRLGAWIEPVLVGEWARLIKDYALTMGRVLAPGEVEARLVWQEPARDTSLARMVAGRMAARGAPITCVWTGTRLSADTLDIDHTLPWSAWPCGDLWNLAPALRRVNQHEKRDRLPSASALARAREPILTWWDEAWNADPALAARFGLEARAALPIDGVVSPDAVFAGMEWRRLRLQQDQQPPEWSGLGAAMAGDWTDEQNDAIVADYFGMLADDIAGRHYSKAEHNRLLQAIIDRPRGSIEYKHQNISAALMGLGEDWIPGYKPAFNFQASLVDAAVRWLDHHPDWLAPATRMAITPSPSAFRDRAMLWIGPPPTHSNAPPPEELEQMTAIARKYDVAGRDARNRALGRAGEERILAHERAGLLLAGRTDLADRIRWVSDLDGDGAGYDIRSFDTDGAERLIEVKTTNGWERTPFHITRNELSVSEVHRDEWRLMRLWNFAREPKAFELRPPLEAHVSLMATSYQASLL